MSSSEESNPADMTVEQLKQRYLKENADLLMKVKSIVEAKLSPEELEKSVRDMMNLSTKTKQEPEKWPGEDEARQLLEHPPSPEDPLAILPTDSESEIESKIRKRWGLKPV